MNRINFNRAPYFDDYDPNKHYHKILFKEGVPLQVRELNQLQTILQEQIARFGRHFFKDGSIVSGCENKFNFTLSSIEVELTERNLLVLSRFNKAYAISSNGSIIYISYAVSPSQNSWNPSKAVLVYSNISGVALVPGQTIYLYDYDSQSKDDSIYLTLEFTDIQQACSITMLAGIIFFDGYFIYTDKQDILIDPYSSTPTVSVGYKLIDSISTWKEDFSLLDNALLSDTQVYNRAATGADRLKKELILTTNQLIESQYYAEQSVVGEFIEFVRIVDGEIIKDINTTVYSEFEKNLARRTFDEAGNFTVRPFQVRVVDHVDKNPDFFSIEISPGKAYIKGFEFETKGRIFVNLPRNSTTLSKDNFAISTYYGSYIKLDSLSGLIDVSKNDVIELLDQPISSFQDILDKDERANHTIGTARSRFLHKVGSDFWLFLYDPIFTSGSFESVKAITSRDNTGFGDLKESKLFDPANDKLIFKFAEPVSSLAEYSYYVQRVFKGVRFNFNSDTNKSEVLLKTDGNTSFVPNSNYFIVFRQDTLAYIPLDSIVSINDNNTQVRLSLTDSEGLSADVFCVVWVSGSNARIPIIKSGTFEETSISEGWSKILDGKVLGTTLVSVFLGDDESTDIKDLFTVERNENLFRYGSESIRFLGKDSISGNVTFNYTYHSLSSDGFFSANYWNLFDYSDIDLGRESYEKRQNVLDFRPLETSEGVFDDIYCISPFNEFECSYSYFVGRIDKLACTPDKTFAIISGIPSLNPTVPKDRLDWMTLYTLGIPPGVTSPDLVKVVYHENKRYTMRDIGRLDQRIKNLEYYTSLTLLEKDTASFEIIDEQGNTRFKNGFLVDNFKNFKSLDTSNLNINCSFDLKEGILRPSFILNNRTAYFNEPASRLVKSRNGLVTLPYIETVFIQQPLASDVTNLQPYEVFTWIGTLTLEPTTDDWIDTTVKPDVIVNQFGEKDVWNEIGAKAFQTEWKSWETHISKSNPTDAFVGGQKGDFTNLKSETQYRLWNPDVDSSVPSEWIFNYNSWVANGFKGWFKQTKPDGYVNGKPALLLPFKVEDQTTIATGTQRSFTDSKIISNSLGENVTGVELIPFMRSKVIKFSAKSLKPNTRLYAFFDNKEVTSHCRSNGVTGILTTTATGSIDGEFIIPSGVFVTGTRIFELSDSFYNRDYEITTRCSTKYTARGVSQVKTETFLSSREPQIIDTVKISESKVKVYDWDSITFLPTPSPSPSTTPTPSPSPSPTPTPSGTPTPSPSPTTSVTPSGTPTPSVTPSGTPTPSVTPSRRPPTTLVITLSPYDYEWNKAFVYVTSDGGVTEFKDFRSIYTVEDRNGYTYTPNYTYDEFLVGNLDVESTKVSIKVVIHTPDLDLNAYNKTFFSDLVEIRDDPNLGYPLGVEYSANINTNLCTPILDECFSKQCAFPAGTDLVTTSGISTNLIPKLKEFDRRRKGTLGTQQFNSSIDLDTVVKGSISQYYNSLYLAVTGSQYYFSYPTSGVVPEAIVKLFRQFQNDINDHRKEKIVEIQFDVDLQQLVVNHLHISLLGDIVENTTKEPIHFYDPIAETFEIEKDQYPSGLFLTGVDLYFKTKSNTVPITVELRETVNGYPHDKQCLSRVSVDPTDIFVSNDSSIPTRITFESPTYLLPGTFALCVITNTTEYTAFVGTIGEYIIGSATERISKNPYIGTFFKSMNSSTWVPQPETDLKFNLYRAVFPINTEVDGYFQPEQSSESLEFNSMCINGSIITPGQTSISKIETSLKSVLEESATFNVSFNETTELDNTFIIPSLG